MKKILFIAVAAMLLLCSGCKKQAEDLKFYVVKQEAISADMATDVLIQTAKKEGRLAFTGADLEGWYWADHTLRLEQVNVKGSAADGGSVLFQTEAGDVFLLMLGNRLLYSGTFDAQDEGIFIADAGERDFKIHFQNPYGDLKDPRGNQTLYEFLADQQLLLSELK